MKRLKDKVAIITDGAGGIGLVTAELFLEDGAKVILVDLKENLLKKAVHQLASPNCTYVRADVSNAQDVKTYTDETLNRHGKIDIFFDNAGMEGVVQPIEKYLEDVFDKGIATNLKGVWLSCQ